MSPTSGPATVTRVKLQRCFERDEWRKARSGSASIGFLEHHLQPLATPSPNLMIAAASQQHAAYQICEYGHLAGDDRAVHGWGPLAAGLRAVALDGHLTPSAGRIAADLAVCL